MRAGRGRCRARSSPGGARPARCRKWRAAGAQARGAGPRTGSRPAEGTRRGRRRRRRLLLLRRRRRGVEHVRNSSQESEDGHQILPRLRPTDNKHEAKRRRTERVRREKINSTVNKDLENRKRSRSNSHSDHIRRGRGRPKSASAKKHEEEREKQEKEIDIYANLSDEKAFVFSVALAEINRKIINQRLIL
uniref:Chromosome 16 open reading frame 87 n=1 Tax=Ornithorhynchus anatinus TaxID=9258 RepID=A0A6I8PK24_ORNAN